MHLISVALHRNIVYTCLCVVIGSIYRLLTHSYQYLYIVNRLPYVVYKKLLTSYAALV